MDPLARRAFWDLINDLSEAGTTILVSTHYMEEAEYCNRLILMNRGRIIAAGSPDELRATVDAGAAVGDGVPRARPSLEDVFVSLVLREGGAVAG